MRLFILVCRLLVPIPEASGNLGLLCVWPVGLVEGQLSGITVPASELSHLSGRQEHGSQGTWGERGHGMEVTIPQEQHAQKTRWRVRHGPRS